MPILNIKIPNIEAGAENVTIIRWFFKEGNFVRKEDDLVEIELNKVTTIIKSTVSGILEKILIKEGEVVTIDEDIARIDITENNESNKSIDKFSKEVTSEPSDKEVSENRIKASPIAKKIAKEKNIDLSKIKGSGPYNRVVLKDVQVIDEQFTVSSSMENYEEHQYKGIQKRIGDKLLFSKTHIPHYYLTISINMKKSLDLIKNLNKDAEYKLTINDWIVFATSRVIPKYKYVNCSIIDDRILLYKNVNIGIAVSLEDKVYVPVIKNANLKSIIKISEEIKLLIKKLKDNTIKQESLLDGTFTISNLGMYNIDEFNAIINPYETAILAIGTIIKKPWVIYKEDREDIEILPIMKMSLSVDHRIINGVQSANFLNSLKDILENPEKVLLFGNEL